MNVYRPREIPDEEKLRNTLSIRWSDKAHDAVTEWAWQHRLSAAEFCRQCVVDELRRNGVEI